MVFCAVSALSNVYKCVYCLPTCMSVHMRHGRVDIDAGHAIAHEVLVQGVGP